MLTRISVVAAAVALACVARLAAQAPPDDKVVWNEYLTWCRTAPPAPGHPVEGYAASLQASGTSTGEVERRRGVLMRLIMGGRTDWVECAYDRMFSTPRTGSPPVDGFASTPSALVVQAAQGLAPGAALDAGMGQGRNAVYLATRGWKVTGVDLSGEAVKAAVANAAAAGVPLDAVKASYDEFDFGVAKWDLVVLVFAWAPMDDPAFVDRLGRSLRPDGLIVFEHFVDDPARPRPPAMHALKPGQLRAALEAFRLDRYEELTDLGDWGGPGMRLVRAVAVKR